MCHQPTLPCQDHAPPAAAAAARPLLRGLGAGQHQPAAAGAAQATQDWEWGAYYLDIVNPTNTMTLSFVPSSQRSSYT